MVLLSHGPELGALGWPPHWELEEEGSSFSWWSPLDKGLLWKCMKGICAHPCAPSPQHACARNGCPIAGILHFWQLYWKAALCWLWQLVLSFSFISCSGTAEKAREASLTTGYHPLINLRAADTERNWSPIESNVHTTNSALAVSIFRLQEIRFILILALSHSPAHLLSLCPPLLSLSFSLSKKKIFTYTFWHLEMTP